MNNIKKCLVNDGAENEMVRISKQELKNLYRIIYDQSQVIEKFKFQHELVKKQAQAITL